MLTVRPCTDQPSWDGVVDDLGGHPLQLWGWGEQKSRHGWGAVRYVVLDDGRPVGGAQVLTRATPVPTQPILYSPRGPFWADGRGEDVVRALAAHLRSRRRGVVWTVEPDDVVLPAADLFRPGQRILMSHTLIVDLTTDEETILANMRSKSRQHANKALRSMEVRRVDDPDELREVLAVYHETAARADFGLHEDRYYLDIQETLGEACRVIVGFDEQGPVAFLWNAVSRRTAFELYGGVNERGHRLRANYGLKLAAIRDAREHGCERYDMNGLLTEGITEFKTGFAKDHVDDLVGTFDLPLSPLYPLYARGLPLAKQAVRRARALLRR